MREFIIRRILKYGSWLLTWIEKPLIKRNSSGEIKHSPVFIIGPPRTGSTILYQALTQKLEVLYIDNLINMARNNTFIGFYLSQKIYGNTSHNSNSSDRGATKGLHSPNEGLFWYKWLPKDKHHFNPKELKEESISEIQNLLTAITNKYDKPLLFKNLSFSVRLPFIKRLFPDAKIIYIKRNPLFVVQSVLLGKRKSNTPPNQIWSIKPKQYKQLAEMNDEIQQVVWQVYLIEKQIHEDIVLFNQQQVITVEYENLTEDVLNHLTDFIKCPQRKTNDSIDIHINNSQRLDDAMFAKINNYIDQLDWINFTSEADQL